MTQAQAALLAGCGLRTWKRWEGEGEADAAALGRVAEALGCTITSLSRPPKITGVAISAVTRAVEKHGTDEVVGAVTHALGGNAALIRWTRGQV